MVTRRAPDRHQSRCGTIKIGPSTQWKLIGRLRGFAKELHDRGLIEPRSRRDRAAIMALPSFKATKLDARFHRNFAYFRSEIEAIAAYFWSKIENDRGPIVALLEAKLKQKLPRNWSHAVARRNRSHDSTKPLPQPLQLATIFGPISSWKPVYSPFFVLNFWLIREGIKQISRKISSPPCLDSIAKQLERDWSRISPWFHRIFPLNSERPRGRIWANSLQSTRIGAPSLRQSG